MIIKIIDENGKEYPAIVIGLLCNPNDSTFDAYEVIYKQSIKYYYFNYPALGILKNFSDCSLQEFFDFGYKRKEIK